MATRIITMTFRWIYIIMGEKGSINESQLQIMKRMAAQ